MTLISKLTRRMIMTASEVSIGFGTWFRDLRETNGYTLRGMAKVLEVTPSYLSQVERGGFTPLTIEKLVLASTSLNVPIATLLDKAGRCEYCGGFKHRND
jgi:transcriptional regulator with XRE-family HTH domain